MQRLLLWYIYPDYSAVSQMQGMHSKDTIKSSQVGQAIKLSPVFPGIFWVNNHVVLHASILCMSLHTSVHVHCSHIMKS